MKSENNEILVKATRKWGKESQKNSIIIKCSQLVLSLMKNDEEMIARNMADMELMIAQHKILYRNTRKIEEYKDAKIEYMKSKLYGNKLSKFDLEFQGS